MNNATTQTTMTDIFEVMEKAKSITRKYEFDQAGFNFHAIVNKCTKCGFRYSASQGVLRVCVHQLKAIKEHCGTAEEVYESRPFGVSPLVGMQIEVH